MRWDGFESHLAKECWRKKKNGNRTCNEMANFRSLLKLKRKLFAFASIHDVLLKERKGKEKRKKAKSTCKPSLQLTVPSSRGMAECCHWRLQSPEETQGNHQLSGNKGAVSLEESSLQAHSLAGRLLRGRIEQWLQREKNNTRSTDLSPSHSAANSKRWKQQHSKTQKPFNLSLERGEKVVGASDIERERETEEMALESTRAVTVTLISLPSSQHVTILDKTRQLSHTYIRVGELDSYPKDATTCSPFLTVKHSMHKDVSEKNCHLYLFYQFPQSTATIYLGLLAVRSKVNWEPGR